MVLSGGSGWCQFRSVKASLQKRVEVVETVDNGSTRECPPSSSLELVARFGDLRRAVLDVMRFVEDNAEELV
jgi:hypothetical protein